jgi:hypothetical protein
VFFRFWSLQSVSCWYAFLHLLSKRFLCCWQFYQTSLIQAVYAGTLLCYVVWELTCHYRRREHARQAASYPACQDAPVMGGSRACPLRRHSPERRVDRNIGARMRRTLRRPLHMGAWDDASEEGSGENKKRLDLLRASVVIKLNINCFKSFR